MSAHSLWPLPDPEEAPDVLPWPRRDYLLYAGRVIPRKGLLEFVRNCGPWLVEQTPSEPEVSPRSSVESTTMVGLSTVADAPAPSSGPAPPAWAVAGEARIPTPISGISRASTPITAVVVRLGAV